MVAGLDAQIIVVVEEPGATLQRVLAGLAPPPGMRLFTVADQGLAFSDDATCSWAMAGGALTGQPVTDAYVNPVTRDRGSGSVC